MSQLSERYASALFDVTNKKGNTSDVLATLLALKESLLQNNQILEVLNSPLITETDKLGILENALSSSINEELKTFLKLIAKNNRFTEIPGIVTAFQGQVSQALGVVSGTVQSAAELSETEKVEVKKLIEKELATKVELDYVVNPKMIAGIEARVGSFIFEDSIKSHMQKLNDFITRSV